MTFIYVALGEVALALCKLAHQMYFIFVHIVPVPTHCRRNVIAQCMHVPPQISDCKIMKLDLAPEIQLYTPVAILQPPGVSSRGERPPQGTQMMYVIDHYTYCPCRMMKIIGLLVQH